MPKASAYNEKYHNDWAWSLSLRGATDEEMAQAFGISVRTLHRWKNQFPSLKEAIDSGKDTADAKVERSLYQRAVGYETKEVEQIVDTDKATGKQIIGRTKVTTKQIAPDTMAIMYWLNNRKRSQWAQRQEVNLSAGEEGEDVMIYLPANGRDADE